MKTRFINSIAFKILFFYILLSLITISFVISIIFENQVDLISTNIQLESERQIGKLVNSMKNFAANSLGSGLFDIENDQEYLDRMTEFIGPHFDNFCVFDEKGVVVHQSTSVKELPKNYIEDALRSVTANTFSGNDYYLRIDEEKKIIYCYIPLSTFNLGNTVLLLEKNISTLSDSLKSLYRQATYIIVVVIVFHIIFAVILLRMIIFPVNTLARGVKRFSDGDLGVRIRVNSNDEINTLADNFNSMAETIEERVNTLSGEMTLAKEDKDKIEKQKIRDALTGFFNRNYVAERLEEELIRARIRKTDIAFVLVDLDKFNEINKFYGNQTGNIIIMETAKIIKRNSGPTDIPGRIDGEKFSLLCTESSAEELKTKSETIRAAIEKNSVVTPDGEFSVTASFGVIFISAEKLKDAETGETLFSSAEATLQQAKQKGKNRVEIIIE